MRDYAVLKRAALAAAVLLSPFWATPVHAGDGPLGIDHRVAVDDGGIWARRNQHALIAVMLAAEVGGALWEGGETRLGRTLWKSVDATLIGGVSAVVLKRAFSRVRPSETDDPNQWFKGGNNSSFPSGEVTATSAIVTPLVLEYAHDHPAVYVLELLPLYDAIARVKVRGHWQSDVVAGFVLGTAAGYFMYKRPQTPFVLSVMPGSVYVGFKKAF